MGRCCFDEAHVHSNFIFTDKLDIIYTCLAARYLLPYLLANDNLQLLRQVNE